MKPMKDITVMLTSVGGPVAPSYVHCLKTVQERHITVIGVDSSLENAGRFIVDAFEKVPLVRDEDEYVKAMLEISTQYNVDAIVPSSETESLALAKHRDRFEDIGTKLICSNYEIIKLCSDKSLFCDVLKEHGFPAPEIYSVKTLKQFKEAAKALGYPGKAIIMKPKFGIGSRGVRILDEQKNRKDILFNEKPENNIFTIMEDIEKILQDDDFPELVVSEYLPKGIEYSVDILARDGEMLMCAPKLRMKKIVGLSLFGVINRNEEVENLCREMCKIFKLSYNNNIQFKQSEDNKFVPFEINPRIAASISLAAAAGANLLYFGVKLGLGEDIPKKVEINNKTKMYRHLQEVFVSEGESFSL